MIRDLKQKGWTISAISQETGFDRKTIRKYLKDNSAPQTQKRKQRKSKLDPYKPYLLQRIKEGTTNCVVLLEEIQTQGYEGKSTILITAFEIYHLCHTFEPLRTNNRTTSAIQRAAFCILGLRTIA